MKSTIGRKKREKRGERREEREERREKREERREERGERREEREERRLRIDWKEKIDKKNLSQGLFSLTHLFCYS